MSLIITSSDQSEQYGRLKDGRTRGKLGVEKFSDYKNHFTVPVKIPSDAEIAVESVKIHRGALYDIKDNSLLYRYWGRLQENANVQPFGPAGADRFISRIDEILSMPIPIRPEAGTYTLGSWAQELNTRFMTGYQSPEQWAHDQVVNVVSNASGAPTSLSIEFTQRGSASGSDITGSLTANDWINPYRFSVPKTLQPLHGLHYGFATQRLTRFEPTTTEEPPFALGYIKELDDRKGCAQMRGNPLGLVHGKCIVKFDANASNLWRCGFARPQQEWLRGIERQICNMLPGVEQPKDQSFGVYGNYHYPEFAIDPAIGGPPRYQVDYYDYCVEFNEDGELEIYHTEYDSNPDEEIFVKSSVQYWDASYAFPQTQQTYTSLSAAGWDSLKFETFGDEIRLWAFDTTGMVPPKYLVSSTNSSLPGRCWNPINECRNALYFKASLGKQNQYITLDTLESHYNGTTYAGEWSASGTENYTNSSNYRYPLQYSNSSDWTQWEYSGDSFFVTGDDFYSNNRVPKTSPVIARLAHGVARPAGIANGPVPVQRDAIEPTRPYGLDQTFICDTKRPYRLWVESPTTPYVFDGLLGASNGIDYEHALVIGPIAGKGRFTQNAGSVQSRSNGDYLEGRYSTNEGLGQPNLTKQLGFGPLSYLVQSDWDGTTPAYVNVPGGDLQVIFTGPSQIEFRSSPCFVRLPRLTIQSFNGAKSSVSKIVYQVPKFSNEGRQLGELYFAPGEKTYIRLENTQPFLLNSLDIQLVDAGEQVVEDLAGPTIVVFHIRKARN